MARTFKDLLLALLNATLLLVALCLFLGWKLASTVQEVTSDVTQTVQAVSPLREEAQGIRGELSALRSELTTLRTGDGVLDEATKQRVDQTLQRLNQIEDRLQTAQARFADMANSPENLIDRAIDTSADVVADRVIAIRGCVPEV